LRKNRVLNCANLVLDQHNEILSEKMRSSTFFFDPYRPCLFISLNNTSATVDAQKIPQKILEKSEFSASAKSWGLRRATTLDAGSAALTRRRSSSAGEISVVT
jgi:hypothetical protein